MVSSFFIVALAAAPAPDAPKVAIFASAWDAPGEQMAGKVEVVLGDALKNRGIGLADLTERFSAPAQESTEGATLLEQGKQAYDNLDLDGAIAKLDAAASFFLKHPAAASPEKTAEVFLFRGAAHLQNGSKAASQDFAVAAALAPQLHLDPKLFDASVQKAFEAAKKARSQKSSIAITSLPTGATAELDGMPVGLTPVPAREVPLGKHLVRLTRPGYVPSGAFTDVTATTPGDAHVTLTPLPLFVPVLDQARSFTNRQTFDTAVMPAEASELGKNVGARYVVLIGVKNTQADAQVWDVVTNNRLRDLKFDAADAAATRKAAESIALWISRPAPAVYVDVSKSRVPEVMKKWWFWTAAAGVVVVAAGTAVAVAASQSPRGFDVVTGLPR